MLTIIIKNTNVSDLYKDVNAAIWALAENLEVVRGGGGGSSGGDGGGRASSSSVGKYRIATRNLGTRFSCTMYNCTSFSLRLLSSFKAFMRSNDYS